MFDALNLFPELTRECADETRAALNAAALVVGHASRAALLFGVLLFCVLFPSSLLLFAAGLILA